MPRGRIARFLLLACLGWGLVFAPFAHAIGLTAPAPASETRTATPCHPVETQPAAAPDDCCCHPGTTCHCALPAALPASPGIGIAAAPSLYAGTTVSFLLHALLPPDPPPPRRA
jgi:hypothetical protein